MLMCVVGVVVVGVVEMVGVAGVGSGCIVGFLGVVVLEPAVA